HNLWNAVSISSAAAAEDPLGCAGCCISAERWRASPTLARSVAESSDIKSAGTFELLIRSPSGSKHLAEYGSPTKLSSDCMANSGFSIRVEYESRRTTFGP